MNLFSFFPLTYLFFLLLFEQCNTQPIRESLLLST